MLALSLNEDPIAAIVVKNGISSQVIDIGLYQRGDGVSTTSCTT